MRLNLHILSRFLASRTTQEFRRLIFSMSILHFAIASVSLFEPIYLYRLGYGLRGILMFYFAAYAATFILYPLGVRISARFGYHHTILFASPFLIVYFLSLFALKFSPWFLIVAILAFAMQIILYWPNVHLECVREACEDEQGRELSNLTGAVRLAAVFGPVVGGLLIGFFGFPALFAVASVLIMVSNIPLMTLPERRDGQSLGYAQAFRNLIDRSDGRGRIATASLGFGEEIVTTAVWPIALMALFSDYTTTGAAVSASILITTVALLFIGKMADGKNDAAVLRAGSLFTALAWIGRILVGAATGAIFADLFYRISRNTAGIPLFSRLYGTARRGDARAVIAFFEMHIFLGKILACAIGILLLTIFPDRFEPLFIMAAAFSLLFALMPKSPGLLK